MATTATDPTQARSVGNALALRAAGLLAIGQTIALIAIGTRWFVFGSPAGRWVYPYIATLDIIDVTAAASLAAIVIGGTWVALKYVEVHEVWTVAGALLGLTIVSLELLHGRPQSLSSLVQNDAVNGFYSAARQVDIANLLSGFSTTVQQFPLHVRANLPGKILFYAVLLQISERPEVLALIIAFVANLSAVVVYVIVRELTRDRSAALMALVLVAVTPSKVLFVPDLNVVSPLPALMAIWMLIIALERDSRILAACVGLWVFVAFLFEPLPLALGLVGMVLLTRHIAVGALPAGRALLPVLTAGVVGFAATYALFFVAVGFNLFGAFRWVLTDAVQFNVDARRDYGVWLWPNLKEHLFGMGAASAMVFLWVAANALFRPLADRLKGGDGAMRTVALGSLATLVALALLGVNRGEVTRLWIFLTPLAQATVAYSCRTHLGLPAYLVIVAGAVTQTALCATTVGFMIG